MKAKEVFDECYRRYRGLREWLTDSTGAVRSISLDSPSPGYRWRPNRARACEFIADFERIGRHALRRPEWKGRLKLFEVYFLRGAEYRRAISLVGVSEGTFDYWYGEVKRALGAEYSRTGLFPPSSYFRSLSASNPAPAAGNAPQRVRTTSASGSRGRPDRIFPAELSLRVAPESSGSSPTPEEPTAASATAARTPGPES